MQLRSTGLGKTLLHCKVAKIENSDIVPETLKQLENGETGPKRLLITMHVTEPVTWTVHAFVEPVDLRDIICLVLRKPTILWHAVRFLLFGNGSSSLPAKQEGVEAST